VEGDDKSSFFFKAMLQTPIVYAKEGEVRYRIGIGLGESKIEKKVDFFGKWRVNRDLSLDFIVRYRQGKVYVSNFKTEYSINLNNKIGFSLKDERGNRLGIEVVFTRRFFKDAETFIRYRDSAVERAIEAGVRIPF